MKDPVSIKSSSGTNGGATATTILRNNGRRRRRFRRDYLVILWTIIFTYYYSVSGNVLPPSQSQGSAENFNNDDLQPHPQPLDSDVIDESILPGTRLRTLKPVSFINYICFIEIEEPPLEVPDISDIAADEELEIKWEKKFKKWAKNEVPGVNCTPPGIDDFPDDLFTQKERQSGWVAIHFLVSLYIFVGLAVVCDDYFVPSMERICEGI